MAEQVCPQPAASTRRRARLSASAAWALTAALLGCGPAATGKGQQVGDSAPMQVTEDAWTAEVAAAPDVPQPPDSDPDAASATDSVGDADAATADSGAAQAGCTQAEDCPDSGSPCVLAVCVSGKCTTKANPVCQCGPDKPCPDDGNLCTGAPFCNTTTFPWGCQANPSQDVHCDMAGDTACAVLACAPATGKCQTFPRAITTVQCASPPGTACWNVLLPPGAPPKQNLPCEDDDPCTVGDLCEGATCKAGTSTCVCGLDKPCPDDGNLCNGVWFCDVSVTKGKCTLDPTSVVVCPSVDDNVCQQNTCEPKTGQCKMKQAANLACDDGIACTTGDYCAAGTCVGSANTCTCQKDADCASQEDGNLCNGVLFCNQAVSPPQCQVNPASVVTCNQSLDGPCQRTVCAPKTGQCLKLPVEKTQKSDSACAAGCTWIPLPAGVTPAQVPCDDGSACTQGEQCSEGKCTATANVCSCQKDSDCLDDGDACNGMPYCDKAAGKCAVNPASAIVCDKSADTACLRTVCAPAVGKCVTLPSEKTQKKIPSCDPSVTACEWVPIPAGYPLAPKASCGGGGTCQSGVCSAP